jgi:hypothetical protein
MTIAISLPGGAAKKKGKSAGNKLGHLPPPQDLRFIQFTGFWQGFSHSFQVMPAPDQGPLVTGGFPIINVVQRPQRISLTIPAGYDPVTLDIPVQFEAWSAGDNSQAQLIEEDISILEWMYGRGAFGGPGGGPHGVGPPPTVQIATLNSAGQTIPLLSSNYQFLAIDGSTVNAGKLANGAAPNYEITSISWDPTPLRVPAGQTYGGCRLRQLATISVQQIESDPYITTPGTAAAQSGAQGQTVTVTTRDGDTFLTIARRVVPGHNAAETHAIATSIMNTNSSNSKLARGIGTKQKKGITVKVTPADRAAT